MSNYFYRDDDGNWFISSGKNLTPVVYSASLEVAFKMGQIAAIEEIVVRAETKEMNENPV